jgi:hypothetical protein
LAVVLLDRGHQYDSFAKRINWKWFLEFELYQKYSNSHIWIWMFSTSLIHRYFGSIGFYTFVGFQRHIICNFWTYRRFSMHFTSFSTIEIYLNQLKTGLATWRNRTGRYRFSWIANESRRILWCFNGPDRPVTVRLSDLFPALGSRSHDRG